MTPLDEWSIGARITAAVALMAVVGGAVFWFLWGPGSSGAGLAAAEPTAAQTAPVLPGAGGEIGAPRAAQPGGTAPTPTSIAPTYTAGAPATVAAPSGGGDGTLALAFTDVQLDQAGKVATAWVSGIATIRWDEDQDARSDRLRAYLADPNDTDLNQWLGPAPSFLTDLTDRKTVLTGTATVEKVLTVARGSVLLQVNLSQITSHDGVDDPTPSTAAYVVTLVPRGDTWLVSAMIGASGGDPGYQR